MAKWEYKNEFVPMLEKTAMYLRQFNEDRKKLQKEENLKAFGQQFGEAVKGVADITQLSKAMTDWTQKAYAMDIPEAIQTVNQFAQMKKVELDENRRLKDLDEGSKSLLQAFGGAQVIHDNKLMNLGDIDWNQVPIEKRQQMIENTLKYSIPTREITPYVNEQGLGKYHLSYGDKLGRRVEGGTFVETETGTYDDPNTEEIEMNVEPSEIAKMKQERAKEERGYEHSKALQDNIYWRQIAADRRKDERTYNKAKRGVLRAVELPGGSKIRGVIKLDPNVSFDEFWAGQSRYITVDAETGTRVDNYISRGIGGKELEKQTESDYKKVIDAYFLSDKGREEKGEFKDLFGGEYYNASPHYIVSILNHKNKNFQEFIKNDPTAKQFLVTARQTKEKAIAEAKKEGRISPFEAPGQQNFINEFEEPEQSGQVVKATDVLK